MQSAPLEVHRIRLALRLGWLFAEAAGHLRQPSLEWIHGPNRTPRLFLSHPSPTSGELLCITLQELVAVGAQLYPPEDKKPPICPPPTTLMDQMQAMSGWLSGEKKATLDQEQTFKLLDEWSRSCWIQLGVEDSLLQTAASLGASLGDTYWVMQVTQDGNPPNRKESWRYLLSAERTYRLIESLRTLEPYLPADIGTLLRHSLWEWGIAEDLERAPQGQLRLAHPWHWVQLKKRHQENLKSLEAEEETRLRDNLGKQRRNWDELLAGQQPLLRPKDLRAVRWLAGIVFVLLAVILGALTLLGLTAVLALAYRVAVWLFPLIARPTKSEDWLAIGGALVSVLSFVGPLLWHWSRWALGLYDRIFHWGRLAKLKQRTLHRWDGRDKSYLLIAWQHLRHPDAR